MFDENGNKLYVIEEKYSNIKFTEAHKEEILNLYKSDPVTRQYYELIAKNVIFPASFLRISLSAMPLLNHCSTAFMILQKNTSHMYFLEMSGQTKAGIHIVRLAGMY